MALSKGGGTGPGTRGKKHRSFVSSEEELDYEDTVNLHREAELVGEFMEEDEEISSGEELEEGKCASDSEGNDYSEEIQECMKKGNLAKLKQILKLKEEKCKHLQKELHKDREAAKKRKEMEEVLARIQQADKTAHSLQQSLTNSREQTLVGSLAKNTRARTNKNKRAPKK